jgi:pimeloyl-ACP methyl ester carboxylesterase
MILLHGSNSWAREMLVLGEYMRPYEKKMLIPNLLGHGGRPVPDRFTIADFARDVIAYMDEHEVERDFIAGMSVGGYIALYLARHYPGRVEGVVAIATKYVFDAETVKHYTYLLSVERLGQPGFPRQPQFLLNHHPQDWKEITERNRALIVALGAKPEVSDDDLRSLPVPVLVICGEQDPLVPAKEAQALKDTVPRGDLLLVRGPSHPLPSLPLDSVAQVIAAWMAKVRKEARST